MKRRSILSLCVCLIIAFNTATWAQKTDTILYDSMSTFDCEELLARLDNLMIAVGEKPNSTALVVIYDNGNPIENKSLERYIRIYAAGRKLRVERFKLLTARAASEKRLEMWLSENGGMPLFEVKEFDFTLASIGKPWLYIDDWVQVDKSEGRFTFSSACPECCLDQINLAGLGDFLKVNRHLNARITIRGKSRFYTTKLSGLISNELRSEYKIDKSRFRIIYAGIDSGIAQLPSNNASVSIELVEKKIIRKGQTYLK